MELKTKCWSRLAAYPVTAEFENSTKANAKFKVKNFFKSLRKPCERSVKLCV